MEDLPSFRMLKPDPYVNWSLLDLLQRLAFEAELAHLPRSLIAAVWEAEDKVPMRLDDPSTRLQYRGATPQQFTQSVD